MSLNKQLQQIISLTPHWMNLLNYCTKVWKIKGEESVKMKEKKEHIVLWVGMFECLSFFKVNLAC